VQAARREAFEEAAVPFEAPFFALSRTSSVPVSCIGAAARAHWPADLTAIPNHAFAVEVAPEFQPLLSKEHSEFVWSAYDDACRRLHFESNQVALEELGRRIENRRLASIRVAT
jgi:8-oxo-dGTP pyrophosphatase MutT (NUDIX family)